jgi:tRNA (guanine-N7-)-methyltransferase
MLNSPVNPDCIDWSLHYPAFYGIKDNHKNQLYVNTHKHPISYLTLEKAASRDIEESKTGHLVPTIVDIGCGYGGLMFELQKEFPDHLILGMEIRDVVANFVAQKINSIRVNTGFKECINVGVVKTNTMKTIHNYFKKGSVR